MRAVAEGRDETPSAVPVGDFGRVLFFWGEI
jgi:hypothetical protein